MEDWVTIRSPRESKPLHYRVDVSSAAGLRLVSGILELLDAAGTPRLRVGPAWVADAVGTQRRAELALEGCEADRDPAPPWGRPVVAAGASHCIVRVSWNAADLHYPLEVDPPWTLTGSMAQKRSGHSATRLGDGRVLAVGGANTAVAELYDPGTGTWATTGSLSTARGSPTAAQLANGKVLVSGGSSAGNPLASAEVYDPATGTFSPTGGMKTARNGHTANRLPNGRVLIAGGSVPGGAAKSCELYDPGPGTFAYTGPLTTARDDHTATTLKDGRVLVVGTWGAANPELYSHTTGTWSEAKGPGGLQLGLEDHTASLLTDGRVLVIGGRTGGGLSTTDQVALFNPTSKAWTAATKLPGPVEKRRSHSAAVLPDGRVVAIGGRCDDACDVLLNSFDHADGVFWTTNAGGGTWTTSSGKLPKWRSNSTTTLLDTGNVLISGGIVGGSTSNDVRLLCLADGCPCSTGAECSSGLCADGVCCDSACPGTCNACSKALKGQGVDGVCGPILAGTDPQSECAEEAASSCGFDGMCDGAGACRKHVLGTECVPATCIDTTSEIRADTCDGKGNCVDNGNGPCPAPYLCKGPGCKTSCADKTDCATGYECIAGSCKKRPNGTACASGDQCESGNCVDGVCCDSSCDRQCEACAELGSEGTCSPVAGDPRGSRKACTTGTPPCGSTCNGSDPSGCAFPGNETDCGFGKVCDGKGDCVQPGSLCSDDRSQSIPTQGAAVDCAPYLCDTSTGECASACTTASDCIASAFCNKKQCQTGSPAAAPDDGGCSCSHRKPERPTGLWLLLGLAGGLVWRRRRPGGLGAAAVVTATALLGCSEAKDETPPDKPLESLRATAAAQQRVDTVLKRFGERALGNLRAAPQIRFLRDGAAFEARVSDELRRQQPSPARFRVPERSTGALRISDEHSSVGAAISLQDAEDAELVVTDGLAVYPSAAPGGGDVLVRFDAAGLEDYVVMNQPSAPSLVYRVELENVAGLRLVENTLELLDAAGAPRLRVSPPYVIDAQQDRHEARLSVQGCAVDTSPVAPFERPPVAPGSSVCELRVSWAPGLAHPLVVDPSWSTTAGPGVGHKTDHAAAVMADGRLLIAGYGSSQAQVYSSGAWAVTGSMATSRTAPTATLLNTGRVLVAGGGKSSAERYNPSTGTFSSAGTMSASRSGHRAVRLTDNSILITGGDGVGTTQRYLPGSNSWSTPSGSLGSARVGHASTLLSDGRVLVTGGSGALSAKSTRIFSLTGGWIPGPNMQFDRVRHIAVRLSTGRVLVAGGEDVPNGPGAISDSERYNPATNSFIGAAPVPAAQRAAVGVPFGNNSKVYMIGGRGNGAGPISSTWIYTASSNSWINGGSMKRSRFLHTADLLPSGQILIVGGTSGAETLPPAEIQCVDIGCSCTSTTQCLVGTCVDGVCCSTTCTGKCQACSAAKKGSGANGVCGPIADGSDPDNECAAQPASSCGTIGSCNGSGACRLYASGTTCKAANCTSGTISEPASSCDGSGTCVTPATVSCQNGYACVGGSCKTSCQSVADCDTGFVCTGNQCVKKANGETCSAGTECTTGFCVDSVCCDTACTGQCEACNESGTAGLCVQVKGQPKGGKPACGGTGTCAGACSTNPQACTFPTTECGDGKSCQNGECIQTEPICIDSGKSSQSAAGVKTPCTPYLCNPTTGTCLSSCTVAAECDDNFVCVKNQCVDLSGTGGGGGSSGAAGAAGSGGAPASATPDDDSGCACRLVRGSGRSASGWWLSAAALLLLTRRRRGSRRD